MAKSNGKGKVKVGGRARNRGGKEREWREIIDAQRRSGESVRAFCRDRGLYEASFYRWRREIRLRDRKVVGQDVMHALAPVVVIDGPRDGPRDGAASSSWVATAIEILLRDGTTVRIPPDSTREQLDMVLSVLGQARC